MLWGTHTTYEVFHGYDILLARLWFLNNYTALWKNIFFYPIISDELFNMFQGSLLFLRPIKYFPVENWDWIYDVNETFVAYDSRERDFRIETVPVFYF